MKYLYTKNNFLSLKTKLIMFRYSNLFKILTTLMIVLYALIMALKTEISSSEILNFFKFFDYFITIFFVLELVIKISSEKYKMNFFRDNWNLFDFIVITASLIPLSIFESIAVLRILMIVRILRIITINDNIKQILTALSRAVPSIIHITIMMFIVFYIYAILGVQFFSEMKSGLWIDFNHSMLTLFRVMTFEDWTDVMYETMESYPYSWLYFISFIIINAFILFNVFVAIILEEFSKIRENEIKNILDKDDKQLKLILDNIDSLKLEIKNLKKG